MNRVRVPLSNRRLGSGLRRRGGIRIDVEGAERLWIHFARDLQPIANLVTPNRGSSLRAFLASHVAVVKPLIFESLLHGLDRLIGADGSDNAQRDDEMHDCSFHSQPYGAVAIEIRARLRQRVRPEPGLLRRARELILSEVEGARHDTGYFINTPS